MRYLRLSILAVSLTLLVSCAKPPRAPEEAAAATSPETQIKTIPPADPQKYASVKDIENLGGIPLIIRVDGVGLLDVGDDTHQILNRTNWPKGTRQSAHIGLALWPGCGRSRDGIPFPKRKPGF